MNISPEDGGGIWPLKRGLNRNKPIDEDQNAKKCMIALSSRTFISSLYVYVFLVIFMRLGFAIYRITISHSIAHPLA
jgi:hypothetical protein